MKSQMQRDGNGNSGSTVGSGIGYSVSSRNLGAASEALVDAGVESFTVVTDDRGPIICLRAGSKQDAITALTDNGAKKISTSLCSGRARQAGQTVQRNSPTSRSTNRELAAERVRARNAARQQRQGASGGNPIENGRTGVGATINEVDGYVEAATDLVDDVGDLFSSDEKKSDEDKSDSEE
ncbi:MAG: hypothetical protein V1495_03915 [Pseudomonadota bacterium]